MRVRSSASPLIVLIFVCAARATAQPQTSPTPQPTPAPEAPPSTATPAPPAEPPPPPPAEAPPPAAAGGEAGPSSTYFNPSISVIGNFLGIAGHNPVENQPNLNLRESELGLQAIVDPYARADFFLSFGESGVDVEEGFVTFTSLPAGLLVKVGRMRPFMGKINTLHLHVLPWADEPLPVANLLGGDGWIATGVSVARLIPMPADIFSELTAQVFRGQAEGLFEAQKRSDLAYNAHYRVFKDITESTNVDLGFSWAIGPNNTSTPDQTHWTSLEAIDATLRWKPLMTGTYRSAMFRGELFRSRRSQPSEIGGRQTARGWFVSAEYQLAKRWFVGARVESSDHGDAASRRDKGEAVTLTFWPSEFSQVRGEARRRRYAGGITGTEALLQLQFAIGAHGAHPF